MRKIMRIGLCLAFVCAAGVVYADTLYLKNGETIEGILKSEGISTVVMEVGGGTMTFRKSEVDRIEKSSPAQTAALQESWKKNAELSARKNIGLDEARQRAMEDFKARQAERVEAEQKAKEAEERKKEITVNITNGHAVVDTMINERANYQLLLDTGASMLVMPERFARELGIDLDEVKDEISIQLGDGRNVTGKKVKFASVQVGDFSENNVDAALLPESFGDTGPVQGILGMSFLGRYRFQVDIDHKKLVLEKGEKE